MKPVSILIVENEFIIAEKLSADLRGIGYRVTGVAASGIEAIELAEKFLPDLIIMDIKLEGELDGIDTACLINKNYSVPVIYLTGYTDQNLFTRAKFTRPASYLTKPYNPSDVFNAIELALYNANRINNKIKHDNEPTDTLPCIFNDRIFVKDNKNCFNKIDISDITYIKGEGSYSIIETIHGKFTISHNLKTIENKIGNPKIVRVHRSYLVNLSRVQQIIGRNFLVLCGEDLIFDCSELTKKENFTGKRIEIPIGPEYKESIHQIIKFI
jgi:DNA-binding LytR/AlgR family response regulator